MEYYYLFYKLLSHDYNMNHEEKILNERVVIEENFNHENWANVMRLIVMINMGLKSKNLITKRAYKLSCKIKENLDIVVFPVIIRNHLGAIHNDEGVWTWYMLTKNGTKVGSSDSTNLMLLKKNKINTLESDIPSGIEIITVRSE